MPLPRTWLAEVPRGRAWCAAFDTQVRGPFGKGAPEIRQLLEARGYTRIAEPQGFVVKGSQGPLKKGEAERARVGRAARARDGAINGVSGGQSYHPGEGCARFLVR